MTADKNQTLTGWCQRGDCANCDGVMRTGTGWNWWCTHNCHPEPTVAPLDAEKFAPALDFWRKRRTP